MVRAVWAQNSAASLLQLDLKGAFDRVHHEWLLVTLHRAGLPAQLLKWIKGWLHGRQSSMRVDGEETTFRDIPAGVPQGSPLSPILFVLFLAPLYNRLRRDGIMLAGFADDTNILAFRHRPTGNQPPLKSRGVIGKALALTQNKALRRVAGAYKASPIKVLEADMGVPPLDLYIEARRAVFKRRLKSIRSWTVYPRRLRFDIDTTPKPAGVVETAASTLPPRLARRHPQSHA